MLPYLLLPFPPSIYPNTWRPITVRTKLYQSACCVAEPRTVMTRAGWLD